MSGTAADDVELAELQQRLETFGGQLASINELLESDPTNSEFLTIAQDLVEVIQLTKQMIDLKTGNAATTPAPPAAAAVEADAARETDNDFTPGTYCEALSKGVWFPAYIESLTTRDTFNVHYVGFGNKDELPVESLRAIEMPAEAAQLPAREQIDVGFKCEAKYYVDGQYYPAQVTATTSHGYQVLFDGYGNSEEVPYEYLKPLSSTETSLPTEPVPAISVATTAKAQAAAATAAAAAAAASAALKPREAVVAKPIKVPENLQILPTDTEAEKERKKKRFKHIQKLNKQIEVENAHNIKQHDWKSFQHKAQKGKVKGSGALSKRGSMFASPDTVEGRVGVVGSGQGMTHYETSVKKLKTSNLTSAPRL